VTIDCCRLAEMLFDFINGDLSAEQCEVLEAHIQACPPCLIHVQTYRVTITMTRKLTRPSLPPEVEQRLRAALARECGELEC
jgi:anti-sigma factor RsiW